MGDPLPTILDDSAFVRLYDECSEPLLRFFVRRTLDPEAAFDLTAETFAQAYLSRGGYDPARGSASGWLFGIGRHELGDYLRKRRVEVAARERLGIEGRVLAADDYERVEDLIDFAEVGRRVSYALGDLPDDQRQAVVYRVIDRLSYEEIARRVGCSETAARARVSRGLRQLGVLLAATTPDEPDGLGESV